MDNWIAYNVVTAVATGGNCPSVEQSGRTGRRFRLMRMMCASIWRNLIMALRDVRYMEKGQRCVSCFTAYQGRRHDNYKR
jgi:hypothetical protein